MSADRARGEKPASFRLEVLRLPKKGGTATVRCLSEKILGFTTHYSKNGSPPCLGEGRCPPSTHKDREIWKGYIAAEEWDEALQLWKPCCCEITEHCELEMRGRYVRGQQWVLKRYPPDSKKPKAIEAKLLSERSEGVLPPAFELHTCLLIFYHHPIPEKWYPNPLPARQVMEYTQAPPPANSQAARLERERQSELDPEATRAMVEMMKERLAAANHATLEVPRVDNRSAKQILSAKPSTNGTH
jgi:hypothetical protein